MSQPSGSQVHRALACPASLHLPQVSSTESSEEAARGTAIHDYLDRVFTDGRDEALVYLTEQGVDPAICNECSQLLIPTPPTAAAWVTEQALVYDAATNTARPIGKRIGRNYGELGPFEFPMSLDLVGVIGKHGYVVDWKTGHTDYGPPGDSAQLNIGALALAKSFGLETVDVAYGYVKFGEIRMTDWAHLDTFDMELFGERLRDLQTRSASAAAIVGSGRTPDVVTGPHCQYCPAYSACPATTALVRQLPAMAKQASNGGLPRSRMGDAWLQIKSYRKALGQMERAIRAEAAREPIDLPNGHKLGMVTTVGNEKLDGRIAHSVVAEVTGDLAVADTAVELRATKAGIKRALQAHCKNGEFAETERTVYAKIREAGGATKPQKQEVAEYKP